MHKNGYKACYATKQSAKHSMKHWLSRQVWIHKRGGCTDGWKTYVTTEETELSVDGAFCCWQYAEVKCFI